MACGGNDKYKEPETPRPPTYLEFVVGELGICPWRTWALLLVR